MNLFTSNVWTLVTLLMCTLCALHSSDAFLLTDGFWQHKWGRDALLLKSPWDTSHAAHRAWKDMLSLNELDYLMWISLSTRNTSHDQGMVYMQDYRFVRIQLDNKTEIDPSQTANEHGGKTGEMWTAILPMPEHLQNGHAISGPERPDLLDIAHGAFRMGFSVVMNTVNQRWPRVGSFAAHLANNVFGHVVNANLYVTPLNGRAFEPHFDYMDAFVVQLEGRKRWFLYDNPRVTFPRKDMRFKPTPAELTEGKAPREVILSPGDVLYVPAGQVHSCETIGEATNNDVPSMHITFGVESDASVRWEGVMRQVLHPTEVGGSEAVSDADIASSMLLVIRAAANVKAILREPVLPLHMLKFSTAIDTNVCSAEAEDGKDCADPAMIVCKRMVDAVSEWVNSENARDQVMELIDQALDAADLPLSDDTTEQHLARKASFSLAELVGDVNADAETLHRIAALLKTAHKHDSKDQLNPGKVLWSKVMKLVADSARAEERCGAAVLAVDEARKESVRIMIEEQKEGLKRHAASAEQRLEGWKRRQEEEEAEVAKRGAGEAEPNVVAE